MNRRFIAAAVGGALVALAVAAAGAFGHDGAVSGVGHSAGFSLIVLLALAGAGAVSLFARTVTRGRCEPARVRSRGASVGESEARDPDEWRGGRRD
ncbi:MAG: hypothetical protein ABR941_05070 [Thermoleophilia bacterium]